jgi:2-haloacid dehalogenase
MTLDFNRYKALTFDCYGTLIDWETGIATALAEWATKRKVTLPDDGGLALFGKYETAREASMGATLYRDLLGHVLGDMATELGAEADGADRAAFGGSVGDWPAFPDSAEALQRLQKRYKLCILSNVDRASFARSNDRLGVEFDLIVTAEDVKSYKPNLNHFHRAFEQLAAKGIARPDILHVAQSLHHDHVPAKRIGMPSVWINRRAVRGGGWGATVPPPEDVKPDMEFPSMTAFADATGAR